MQTDPITATWIYLLVLVPAAVLCGLLTEALRRDRGQTDYDYRRAMHHAIAWGAAMAVFHVVIFKAALQGVSSPALLAVTLGWVLAAAVALRFAKRKARADRPDQRRSPNAT